MKEKILEQYLRILEDIEKIVSSRGIDSRKVRICCATKYANVEEMNLLIKHGLKIVGENKVQSAEEKFEELEKVERHFIGHLQKNKVKRALRLFDVIESLDSIELAEKINRSANKKIRVMIQVNIAKDPEKGGFEEQDLDNSIKRIKELDKIEILGLMTILSNIENPEETRKYFKKMDELNKKHSFKELSMGMSNDYKIAIEEGATIVRIGSAIFR